MPPVVVSHFATPSLSFSPRKLTTAGNASEGVTDTSEGGWAGSGVEAPGPFPLSVLALTSRTLSGCPTPPFTFCLPQVATNWQLMCSHGQLRGAQQLRLMDAVPGWGAGWAFDSLSKQTLQAGSLSQSWVTSLWRSAIRLLLTLLLCLSGLYV